MSDIVEELRHWETVAHSYDAETLSKAAAEIERLRGVIAARDAEIKALRDTIPPLIEDNERLRGLLRELFDELPADCAYEVSPDIRMRVREALGE